MFDSITYQGAAQGAASPRATPQDAQLDKPAPELIQRRLVVLNRLRLQPRCETDNWEDALTLEFALRRQEVRFIESEREQIAARARTAPRDPHGFLCWFQRLRDEGPGQHDAIFPWLAERATLPEMKWFLEQEVAGEAGFEDLVAMTQLKLPERAKLELARNYWDEMGQGAARAMHGPMLERLSRELELRSDADVVWEALALSNLMVGLAANRQYTCQSLGALGVIEMTAPDRAAQINAGLKRLGVAGESRRYYALHATLDLKHSIAWNREVLQSIVASDPRAATAMAEGALLRLRAGACCFERYRRDLRIRALP